MRIFIAASAAVFLLSGRQARRLLVVPGRQVGSIHLGAEKKLPDWLGKPDSSDAGMMHAWMMWRRPPLSPYLTKRTKALDIYLVPVPGGDGPQKQIAAVYTASPLYRLKNGIHAGSSLQTILHHFPTAKPAGSLQAEGGEAIRFYDDVSAGIAFEVRMTPHKQGKGVCTALIVHSCGAGLKQMYLPLPQSLPQAGQKKHSHKAVR